MSNPLLQMRLPGTQLVELCHTRTSDRQRMQKRTRPANAGSTDMAPGTVGPSSDTMRTTVANVTFSIHALVSTVTMFALHLHTIPLGP